MKRSSRIAVVVAAMLALGATVAVFAHPGAMGPGMMHGMGPGMMHDMGPGTDHPTGHPMGGPMAAGAQHDDAFRADMGLVHDMLTNHESIQRSVTNLPNGIRTLTESQNPKVAQTIRAHVASMEQRLKDGREFNLFSPTIPVLFANKEKINTTVEVTDKGVLVVQTSDDPKVVTALQEHAEEVSELARDGMAAMMRGMRARMMGQVGTATTLAVPRQHLASTQAPQPYAGFENRLIKALPDQQIADLKAGRGMGLALAAELNGYPGPLHVLDLAESLGLSQAQREKTRELLDAMKAETIALGEKLIAQEADLERQFAGKTITGESLQAAVQAIGATQAALRAAHLKYHLATVEVLVPAQIARYAELRGYTGNAPAEQQHGGHRH